MCVLDIGTWNLLDDFINLFHKDLLEKHQVVQQVCGEVVLKGANLQIMKK